MLGFIFVGHFFADFVCQTRQMGDNKSKSFYWLSVHIVAYTIALGLSTFFIFENFVTFTLWLLLNSFLHLCTDFVTSKTTSFFYKKQNWYWFWTVIGLDQLIHIMTLYYTFLWIK